MSLKASLKIKIIFLLASGITAIIFYYNFLNPEVELTKYSTCQFEFLYPKEWGEIIKSQSQQYFTDSEMSYVTTNTYKFSNYKDGLIRLSNNNVGLLWLSVSADEWKNYEPHKVNALNFCQYIQKYRLTNGKYDSSDKINACEVEGDVAVMGWISKDYPEDNDKFMFAGFKELFNEKFSGVAIIIESKEKLDYKDRLLVKRIISSTKIKEGECP